MQILLTTVTTVASGVFVFVIGQIILECYIKPLQEYHKIKSEISYLLLIHSEMLMNPVFAKNLKKESKESIDEIKKARSEFKIAMAKLEGFKQQKPFFVRKDRIEEAQKGLLCLSRGLISHDIDSQIDRNQKSDECIRKSLHLK